MKANEAILQRQTHSIRFRNPDMDFMLNWAIGISQIIGLSPSQVFYAIRGLRDGDPDGWRSGFRRLGDHQVEQAQTLCQHNHPVAAGQADLGAAYAYRAALQYTSPFSPDYRLMAQQMEQAFQRGAAALGVPIRPVEIPFEETTLSGYYLELDREPRPLVVMIGGGDTFREDLFYFAGYPGWKRGYNVLMLDLPGQGLLPDCGLHFRVDMAAPIRVALDWLETHAALKPQQIALYGVSGGGYFTAQAAATDPRIAAWIAATPIIDMAAVFTHEFGSALKAPGWLLNAFLKITGSLNHSAQINLDKYAWQFGAADFSHVVTDLVLPHARRVDDSAIRCPSLFLMSEGEGPELIRQTRQLTHDLMQRGVNVTLHEFTAAQGADGHCQLNNLRFAHHIIFDWLDARFAHAPGDVRLRC